MKKSVMAFMAGIIFFMGWNIPANALMFNGHDYVVVEFEGQTWHAAQDHAVTKLGNVYYLATITSKEEQSFVENLIRSSFGDNDTGEYWIGGFQYLNEAVPDNEWQWITGEQWGYTNWSGGEPNDAYGVASEQYLAIWGNYGWHWNDEGYLPYIMGYVAEAPIPEPATMLLLGIGMIGVVGLRRKFGK